ncbi:MAG: LysR family transcriptional regulator [Planctomycetota bacterium]
MRLFTDVARHRSLSDAAELHGITQSAASQRIQSLEKRLGVRLLDRSVRPIALTAAGEVFLKGCHEIVARTEAIEQEVRMLDREPAGTVRVYAMYSTGIAWLNSVQESFAESFPGVEVQVHYDRPDVIHRAAVAGECDLGLVSFPDDWDGVYGLTVRDEPMALVCRPDHPLAEEREPLPLARLTEYAMAGICLDLPLGRRTLQAIKEAAGSPELVDTFDNTDTLKSVVLEAGCFAILPRRIIERESQAGTLRAIATTPSLSRPFGVIHRKDPVLSPAGQAFLQHIVALGDQTSGANQRSDPHAEPKPPPEPPATPPIADHKDRQTHPLPQPLSPLSGKDSPPLERIA